LNRTNKVFLSFIMALLTGAAADRDSSASESKEIVRIAVGYIDETGKFAIKPLFGLSHDFSEGLAWTSVIGSPDKLQVIDKHGVIKFCKTTSFWPGDFHNGLSRFNRQNQFGFIDRRGTEVIPCQYVSAESFNDGVASVTDNKFRKLSISTTGLIVTSDKPSLHNKRKTIALYGERVVDQEGHPNFVPKQILNTAHNDSNYSDGLASVRLISDEGQEHSAFVDEGSRIVIELGPEVERAGDFHEGFAPVIVRTKSVDILGRPIVHKLGFINRAGNLAIKAEFAADDLNNVRFSDGLARLRVEANTCCYVNKNGKSIGPFFEGGNFHEGLAKVSALVTSNNEIIDASKNLSGYNTRTSYGIALTDKLSPSLGSLKTAQQVIFSVNPDIDSMQEVAVITSSGDASFDEKLVATISEVKPPQRGLFLPKSVPFTFSLKNGQLSATFTKMPKSATVLDALGPFY
jgi:hypothetical protein